MNKFFVIILSVGLFIACGESDESDSKKSENNNTDTPSKDSVSDTSEKLMSEDKTVVPVVLPAHELEVFSSEEKSYEYGEKLAQVDYPENTKGINSVKVVQSEWDISVVLGDNEEIYSLHWGDLASYGTTVKLEIADLVEDEANLPELIIWWNTGDGRNGLIEGFEMERSGITIIDFNRKHVVLDFCYSDFYSHYEAGEGVDTDANDFHAKMDERSVWDICSITSEASLKGKELVITNPEKQIENSPECKLEMITAGTYTYDPTQQSFILKQ